MPSLYRRNNFGENSVMGTITRFQLWNHTHQAFLLLTARIILGLILLAKGIFFISHSLQLKEMVLQSKFAAGVGFWTAYVTFAHLFGGVFIILGLFARFAAGLQVPVLLGALLWILPIEGDAGAVILSLLVLVLLIYILIKGGGAISMDAYLKDHLL